MNTDEQVLSLLTTIQNQNTQILQGLAVTQVGLSDLENDVKCNTQWINGNGKEGAKVRLDRIERDLQSQREDQRQWREDFQKWRDDFIKTFSNRVISAVTLKLAIFVGPVILGLLTWAGAVIYQASIHLSVK